jgi:hypothetical protein
MLDVNEKSIEIENQEVNKDPLNHEPTPPRLGLIHEQSSVYAYPEPSQTPANYLTIGDQHGNFIKTLHSLVKEGWVKFESTDQVSQQAIYETFVALYEAFENMVFDEEHNQENIINFWAFDKL